MNKAAQLKKPEMNKMQLIFEGVSVSRMFGNRILIEPIRPKTAMDEYEERVSRGEEGGLVIPDTAREANQPLPCLGLVLLISDDFEDKSLKEGDAVFYSPYSGSDWVFEKRPLKVLERREVLGQLEVENIKEWKKLVVKTDS